MSFWPEVLGKFNVWNGHEEKIPFRKGCAKEAHGVQREANVSSGAPMKKLSGGTMASAFASTNNLLHQAATKPPTSGSVCTTSNSDDEATVGMDVDLTTPSSDPSLE